VAETRICVKWNFREEGRRLAPPSTRKKLQESAPPRGEKTDSWSTRPPESLDLHELSTVQQTSTPSRNGSVAHPQVQRKKKKSDCMDGEGELTKGRKFSLRVIEIH